MTKTNNRGKGFDATNPWHKTTYICECCGKRTRETGQSESGVGLCAKCFEESGLENEHSDYGHPEYIDNCPTCRALKEKVDKTMTTENPKPKNTEPIVVTVSEKKCGKCLVVKPAKDFWKMRSSKDGLQPQCKPCQLGITEAPVKEPVTKNEVVAEPAKPKTEVVTTTITKQPHEPGFLADAHKKKSAKPTRKSRAQPIGSGRRKECTGCTFKILSTKGGKCLSAAAEKDTEKDAKICPHRNQSKNGKKE